MPARTNAKQARPNRRAHTVRGQRPVLAPQERQARKERVLTQGTPTTTASIADAIVIKDENVFFLTTPTGQVPLSENHGFGLYYHDCRYLNGYVLRLARSEPTPLISDASQGFRALFELTNPEIEVEPGKHIRKDDVGVRWERVLDGAQCALLDVIDFHNYRLEPAVLPISIALRAEFEDIFAIRGLLPERVGKLRQPQWRGADLVLGYDGADGRYRGLTIHFMPAPDRTDGATAQFQLRLQPREHKQLRVTLQVDEEAESKRKPAPAQASGDVEHLKRRRHKAQNDRLSRATQVQSESLLLNAVIERSLRDLDVLKSSMGDQDYFAAGVPWFATLFGRDSLITSLQTLAFDPAIAAGTLRVLARYQGQRVDDWREEQPGKILHELRVGELARLDEIPHNPYYGSVDATPLFLLLFSRHAQWTGDLTLFNELRDNVERALQWVDQYGDSDGDGFVDYESVSTKGLTNQGWKDSGDAIVNADGSLARPPIALVEVQGYVYEAKLGLADLYARVGEQKRAERLRHDAERLRDRFAHDFWLDDFGFFALCLQRDDRPAVVVSSNPGQALWSGIVEQDKAKQTVERLMAQDMFNGWGIRTLSLNEVRYNPLGYHLGTVWPHDNSLIAAGFRRYGFDEAFGSVAHGIIQAAMHFDDFRLAELFAGFAQSDYSTPVRYPVACHPQAWAAGAVPFLIETGLGLEPDAFEHRLRIVRPLLPSFVDRLEVKRLQVGKARVDLSFERQGDGTVRCQVLHVDGQLDVQVENPKRNSEK